MEGCKLTEERHTLMRSYERLSGICSQLNELERLTQRLNEKLNRTEGGESGIESLEKEGVTKVLNIVELFNLLSDKMEESINIIGNNTERSMKMID